MLYRDFKAIEYVRDGLELILKCNPPSIHTCTHMHMHTHTHTLHTLKYSRCIVTIVPQLVDILMLVASYSSDSTCNGSSRKRDIHSNKGTEIWIAL